MTTGEKKSKELKLLIISNNVLRASFRQRIKEYLPYLNDAGICSDIHVLPSNLINRWILFSTASKYDAVLLHKKCLNFFDACILRRFSKKIIYDFDDAVMYSPSKPQSNFSSHYRLFRRTAKMADIMIAGNEYLVRHAKRYCSRVFLLPTGLDTGVFQGCNISRADNKIRLVWIGSEITLKYLMSIKDALEEVGKRNPNIVLRIISDKFFDLENMTVEKIVWSRQAEVPGLLESDIGLAPLPDNRFARGKCGFKLLQYFAAGLAAIASPVSVNSDFIRNSGAGSLAQNLQQWKDEILKMAENTSLRQEYGKNAAQFVKQFDLSVLGKQFCSIIKENS